MEKKIETLRKQAAKLQALLDKFPDLTETKDRWGTVCYSSKMANAICTDVETRHTCGCCNDAPFLAQPYLTFEGERIYSNPERFNIGEKSTAYYGDEWDSDWRKKLEEAGIAKAAIDKLQPQFEKDEKRREAYYNYQEDLSEID